MYARIMVALHQYSTDDSKAAKTCSKPEVSQAL